MSRKTGVALPLLCRAAGLPDPVPEYRFHTTRRWRIDWAWPAEKIGLEVDGGVWTSGRHTRGAGWLKDAEKLNTLAVMGWRMVRATPQQVASGAILSTLEDLFVL